MQSRMMSVAACAAAATTLPLLPGALPQSRREPPVLAARSVTELRAHDDRERLMLRSGDLRLRDVRAEPIICAAKTSSAV